MEFKDFAAVSGKPGIWKVIKPARTGLILESYDDKKTKLVTGPNHRVSVLSEISIYTEDVNKTIPLPDLYKKIFDEFGNDPGVDAKSESDELRAFMKHIAPDHDETRVYSSDIKKLVSWYLTLIDMMKELIEAAAVEKEQPGEDDKKEPETEKSKKKRQDQKA
jgi:hypothetical protein